MVSHRTFTDQYHPITYEPVKDGRLLSAKKDRYTLIEQLVTLIEQLNSCLKGVPKRFNKAKKVADLGESTLHLSMKCNLHHSPTCSHIVLVASKGVLNVLQ